jgi:hypothetical protein
MSKPFYALLLGFFLTFSPLTAAEETDSPEFIYGYPDVSVWTTRRNADGQLKNPLLNVADTLFEQAGISFKAKPYPAKRLFSYLKKGVIPFSMLVRASSLEACCLFSSNPVTSTELRIYRRSASPAIKAKEDLAGKRVIMIRGYSYGSLGKYLRAQENQVQIIDAAGHEAAFQLLERNRGDYVIDYQGPAEEMLFDNPIADLAYDSFKRLDVYLVLSRDYPNAYRLMDHLEARVAELDVPTLLRPR